MLQCGAKLLGLSAATSCEVRPAATTATGQLGHCLDDVACPDALGEIGCDADGEAEAPVVLRAQDNHAGAQVLADGVDETREIVWRYVLDRVRHDLDAVHLAGMLREAAGRLT